MDHKFKCKSYVLKTIVKNLCDEGLGKEVCRHENKSMAHKRKKMINWTSSKLKDPVKRREDKLQTGRKYLQSTYITKEHHLRYKQNS